MFGQNASSKFVIALLISLVVLLCGISVVGYFTANSIINSNAKLKNDIIQFKRLTKDLVRSSNKWTTKDDLENYLKSNITKKDFELLKKDLNSVNSDIEAVGKTIGVIGYRISELEGSDERGSSNDNVTICKDDGRLIDIHGYTKHPQIKNINDINDAPIAKIQFNAINSRPWTYEIYGREYNLTTIVGKREDGQLTFHHKLAYSVQGVDTKAYPIHIVSSDYKQLIQENKWFWFNPRIDASFSVGGVVYSLANNFGRSNNILSIGLDIGLSLSSYGETKVDSLLRIFRIGLGYNIERQSGMVSFVPLTFNLGKMVPLLTNLYMFPQIGLDTNGGVILSFGTGFQL
jgi:hypothetical protein